MVPCDKGNEIALEITANQMDEIKPIVQAVSSGSIKPVYLLHGEEAFFIDQVEQYLEKTLLTEDEKGFNQTIFYGKDATATDIINACRRFPMMAERQVVILREAKDFGKFNDLIPYFNQPQPTTVFIICHKYALFKGKEVLKALDKKVEKFQSDKIKDYKLSAWIQYYLKSLNYTISHKAAEIMAESLGNDLSKIAKEVEKLKISLPEGTTITDQHIEDNIGISKEFNNYELKSAISAKDELKAYQIVQYLAANKSPMVLTLGVLYGFFSDLLRYHGLKDKSEKSVASVLKINPYFVKEYAQAARIYPMKKVSGIIETLKSTDARGKGVGAANLPDRDLMNEMLFKIFN